MRARRFAFCALALFVVGCGGGSDPQEGPKPPPVVDAGHADDFAIAPRSCGYDCPVTPACPEVDKGYVCPSLGAWAQIPHADACAKWDGTFPAKVEGKCTASAPSGEARKYTGPDPSAPGTLVLPDGRRARPAGAEWPFSDVKALTGGMPSAIGVVPGKRWAITIDTGYGPHVVRVIDVDKVAGKTNPVVGLVRFDEPKTLGSGVAFVAPDLIYVPTTDGVVQALKLDVATGAIALDDERTLKLPPSSDRNGKPIAWSLASVAVSPDGKRLVAGAVREKVLLVYDVDATSPTRFTKLGEVDLGSSETFAAGFDPHDATGRFAYATLWGSRAVVEIDLLDPKAPKATRRFKTDKNPQGLAFLDARWMVVANAFGDTVTLVDRMAATSTAIPVDVKAGTHGLEPSSLWFDAPRKRLYASLAGINAVSAWDVDVTSSPPKLSPAGRLPTGWWPGGVATLDDGTLAIANMRAAFAQPNDRHYKVEDGDVMGRTYGSVQVVPPPSSADLIAGEAAVKKNNAVGALEGAPAVTCPSGVDDFPIPSTNTAGKSKKIDHVFFILRENKSFDGIFGDFPGVEGKAELIATKSTGDQDKLWRNARALARSFALSDNYYTGAELSQQGHFWAIYGRSSDYNERTWAVDGYTRNTRGLILPSGGVLDIGQPEEGSLFDWLGTGGVGFEIFGEAMGVPKVKIPGPNPLDAKYPGGFIQSIGHPDVEKACHVAGRLRVLCDLRNFVFMTLPNDHTTGVGATRPTPDTMIAVNDVATGMVIDAISKSPLWASSLIVITEDDPSQGGEHVDIHRTPLLLISPWVKRGYVSKTHIDASSLHKLFAHVFALPYPNVQVEHAALPLDAFTSTPDYSPWDHQPRVWPLACGASASWAEQQLGASWDIDDVDESPGLDRQVDRWLKGEQLQSLTPKMQAELAARLAKKKLADDDDDDD